MPRILHFILVFWSILPQALMALDHNFTLSAGYDLRYFPEASPLDDNNYQVNSLVFINPKYNVLLDDSGKHYFATNIDVRLDQHDNHRSTFDLDDFFYSYTHDGFHLKIGRSIEFWGVTESQQIVNIINQINLADNLYGDSRMGQSMIKAGWQFEFGEFNFFILPEFRERVFPDKEGRPTSSIAIAPEHAQYEHKQESRDVDYALRFTGYWLANDYAFSIFEGTSREPTLAPIATPEAMLAPYYYQMRQYGLEWQSTLDGLLLKMELVYREIANDDYLAGTIGQEYTIFNFFESGIDAGIFVEYLFDKRDDLTFINGQNDIFYGTRLAFNDEFDSGSTLGFAHDLDDTTNFVRLQLDRRIFGVIKASTDATFILFADKNNIIYRNRQDGFFNLRLEYFF